MPFEKENKSRTKIKHEMQALQKIGARLVDLPEETLHAVEMPPELREAVLFAKSLTKHGARRRQMQYIGTLMRRAECESVLQALEDLARGKAQRDRQQHQLERWRDGIVAGDDDLVEDALKHFQTADRQRFLQLVRNARKEIQRGKPPKSSRALFRYLRDLAAARAG